MLSYSVSAKYLSFNTTYNTSLYMHSCVLGKGAPQLMFLASTSIKRLAHRTVIAKMNILCLFLVGSFLTMIVYGHGVSTLFLKPF